MRVQKPVNAIIDLRLKDRLGWIIETWVQFISLSFPIHSREMRVRRIPAVCTVLES
jgi:hypothetical protein